MQLVTLLMILTHGQRCPPCHSGWLLRSYHLALVYSLSASLKHKEPICSWHLLPKSMLAFLVEEDILYVKPLPAHPCAMCPKPLFWPTILARYHRSKIYSPELGLAFTQLYHIYWNEGLAPRSHLALSMPAFQDIIQHKTRWS